MAVAVVVVVAGRVNTVSHNLETPVSCGPADMEVVLLLLCATVLSSVNGVKKCRTNCNEVYTPVCGHDPRLGYNTFCSLEALDKCNMSRGNNYTKIADGPCYPSVREWRTQSQSTTPEEESIKSRKLATRSARGNYLRIQDVG